MSESHKLLIGGNGQQTVFMDASMANRHGMVAGATGTGKTVTLQILAENFSKIGVPVFLADVKGDVSGIGKAAKPHPKIDERITTIGIEGYQMSPSPVIFWDLFGKKGHPIRTTVSEIGPLLLSNLLELNDTQTGILYSCFKIADDQGMLILDLKDLRSMLIWMGDNRADLKSEYGNVSTASIGAIQRGLLVLEEQGAEFLLGEPAIELDNLMSQDFSGRGVINILDASKLIQKSPKLYSTFLLWLLSELFETLPEIGDAEKPKFVMFFDESHLLFDDAPKVLVKKIEQVVRLIRSKGVGIYFISQSPLDIPEEILGQLGLKIQHALRAFTPKDQKAVRTVAGTFRANPTIDTSTVITQLGVGEALVSTLDEDGIPTQVEQVLIRPPESRIGPMSRTERQEQIGRSPYKGRYDQPLDRESAYEMLIKRAEKSAAQEDAVAREELARETIEKSAKPRKRSSRQTPTEAFISSAARSIGSQLGRRVIRGILGSLFKG
ncbi:MAG: DNA helicase HerA-like ATPase [Chitinophagales bacterium]|jgi:DNA helicase HerA-like ATPase